MINDEKSVREELKEILYHGYVEDDEMKSKALDTLEEYVKRTYILGLKDGIEGYAWMKDGVYYVGTTGMTLKEAHAIVDREFESKDQP